MRAIEEHNICICNVSVPPKVLPLVIPKNLLVGERMSITCAVASGSKPLTFMWLRNDSALRGGTSVHIADSSDYSTLHIENLKIEHAGNYTCVVSNAGGTVSYSDTLHVKGKARLFYYHVPAVVLPQNIASIVTMHNLN